MNDFKHYPDTIVGAVRTELVIKKSRFIADLLPLEHPDQANEQIKRLKKEFWDARHNPIAMITGVHGEHARSNDDGEPAGTAGMPMLEVLKKQNLSDVLVMVTRYFGGIKLGAGGLIRAYGQAVSQACDQAQRKNRKSLSSASFEVSLAEAGRWENQLRDWLSHHGGISGNIQYSDVATMELLLPEGEIAALSERLAEINAAPIELRIGEPQIIEVSAPN